MDIDGIVDRIREQEEARRAAAQQVREEVGSTLFTDGGAVEDSFIHTVEPAALDDITVAGVDGGLVRKELHGLDLIMTQAVAAVFRYVDGELAEADYLPDDSPTPRIETLTGRLDRGQVDRAASLHRLDAEVNVAREAADSDVLLLDGSILPQFPDKPPRGSPLRETYDAVIDDYRELYRAAQENGTVLAGVVEDTRGSRVCDLLAANGFDREEIRDGRDSALLTDLLEKGERTLLMEYGAGDGHPILDDMRGYRDAVYSFALKTVKNDRPLRIDILAPHSPSEVADQAASVIYALAGINDTYGVPPLLIEADQRAKLRPHQVELVTKRIRTRLAHLPGAADLRRNRRPF